MNMQISNIGKASWMLLLAGSMLGGAWPADTPATAPQTSRDTLASELHGRIPIAEDVITNLAFGGPDKKTLYVTAGKTLFKIPTAVAGYSLFP